MTKKRQSPAQATASPENVESDNQNGQNQEQQGATIYFAGDSTEIAAEYNELIGQSAARFKASLSGLLIVAGHSASVDEPEHEVQLSHLRTSAVARQLEKHGVMSHQIVCVSRGANEPLVDPSDSKRSWINRRVEITEGALVPRPPAWAQQRRTKKGGAAKS